MRVLLVNPAPPYQPGSQPYVTFPNGLLFIAAVLEKAGHEVQIYDGNIDSRKAEDFVSFAPGLIGFAALTSPNITDAITRAKEFRKLMPDAKIVWGNVHPSLLPEQTLAELYIDYVIIGAGEYTLLELVQHLENGGIKLSQIKGLAYKEDGKIILNEPRPFIKNLDEVPDPAWHLVDVKRYWDITLNTSRGCPFRCTFCYNKAFHKGYRGDFSAARIIAQIERLQKRYGVTYIKFFEDNFTFNLKRLRQFCRLIIDKNIKIKWDCESRADIKEADIALMAAGGCISAGLGVESGSPRLLEFLQKGITIENVEKTFWLMVKYKITPRVYIMEGVPTETIEDFEMTRKLLRRLDNPPYIYMRFVPYPGSVLFDYCVTNGLISPPQKLADWAEYTILSATRTNLSDVTNEVIEDNTAYYRRTYAWQRLRFTMKHKPSYFWASVLKPAGFFRELRALIKIYLSLVFDSTGKLRSKVGETVPKKT